MQRKLILTIKIWLTFAFLNKMTRSSTQFWIRLRSLCISGGGDPAAACLHNNAITYRLQLNGGVASQNIKKIDEKEFKFSNIFLQEKSTWLCDKFPAKHYNFNEIVWIVVWPTIVNECRRFFSQVSENVLKTSLTFVNRLSWARLKDYFYSVRRGVSSQCVRLLRAPMLALMFKQLWLAGLKVSQCLTTTKLGALFFFFQRCFRFLFWIIKKLYLFLGNFNRYSR